jgi:hypothetical protein
MIESEYWRDYELTRDEVNTAIESFYTYVEIHNFAAEDDDIYRTLNEAPTFWNIQLYCLQTAFFIALGRIFDNGKDVHSVHKLLAATLAHPEYFSKRALSIRKTAGKEKPEWLDNYLAEAFEPCVSDLRALKKAVAPYKKKFDSVYGDIRDSVFAHKILKEKERVSELFGKTQMKDIDDMLYFLYDLMESLFFLFHDGRRPKLGAGTYAYKERIKNTTRNVLRTLSSAYAKRA